MALKSPVTLLLVLVVLKTFFDVKLHFHEHTKAWRQTGSFLAAVSQSQGGYMG